MASPCTFYASMYLLILGSLVSTAMADDGSSQLLSKLNQYRVSLSLSPLAKNAGATCMAGKILTLYQGTSCSNSTGLDSMQEPESPNYLTWLSDCNVSNNRTSDAVILPDCVPSADLSSAIETAYTNYTLDVNSNKNLNSSDFTSAGIAISSNSQWFVLILATKSSSGDYMQDNSNRGSMISAHVIVFLLPLVLFLAHFKW